MRSRTILILLALVGCLDRPAGKSVDNLTLQEIGQRITGIGNSKELKTIRA
jgi:hypothetical protein